MVLELLFGIAILAAVAFIIFRIIGDVALGVILVLAVFMASYFLTGAFPELGKVPVIGRFIPRTTEAIAVFKDVVYSIDVLGTSRSSNDNLLVTVANTGKLEVSNFTAYVDGKHVNILNHADSLNSGGTIVLELDWKQDFKNIEIDTGQTKTAYNPG